MSTKAEQYKANEARKNGRTKRESVPPPPSPKRASTRTTESTYVKEEGGSRRSSRKTTGHAKPASTFDHVEEMKQTQPSKTYARYEARQERAKGSRENVPNVAAKGKSQ